MGKGGVGRRPNMFPTAVYSTAAYSESAAMLRAEEGREVEAKLASLTERLNEALDEVRCELCELAADEEEEMEVEAS